MSTHAQDADLADRLWVVSSELVTRGSEVAVTRDVPLPIAPVVAAAAFLLQLFREFQQRRSRRVEVQAGVGDALAVNQR